MTNNIIWIRKGRKLCAIGNKHDQSNPGMGGLTESHLDPIQKWSEENKCGIRTSFDTWIFKNEQDFAFFLLKWA